MPSARPHLVLLERKRHAPARDRRRLRNRNERLSAPSVSQTARGALRQRTAAAGLAADLALAATTNGFVDAPAADGSKGSESSGYKPARMSFVREPKSYNPKRQEPAPPRRT